MTKLTITAIDPNRRISAIKALRDATGLGLAEAGEALESLPYTVEIVATANDYSG